MTLTEEEKQDIYKEIDENRAKNKEFSKIILKSKTARDTVRYEVRKVMGKIQNYAQGYLTEICESPNGKLQSEIKIGTLIGEFSLHEHDHYRESLESIAFNALKESGLIYYDILDYHFKPTRRGQEVYRSLLE